MVPDASGQSDKKIGESTQDSSVPVIVYPGLHKTGSSWLKQAMFLDDSGSSFVYVDDRTVTRGAFLSPLISEFRADLALGRFRDAQSEAVKKRVPLLIADEALCGLPFAHKFVRDVSLKRIKETFEDAKVLITIREQTSAIYSVYGHYIRGGGTVSLNTFLALPPAEERMLWDPIFDRSFYDYRRLLESCEAIFGSGRVLMAPMEWILRDPQSFHSAFGRFTQWEWPGIEASRPGMVVNAAWSDIGYFVARQSNRVFRAGPIWDHRKIAGLPGKLGYRADKLTPAGVKKAMRRRTQDRIRRQLGDHYAESNSWLSDRLKIDLKSYGYRV